MSTESPSPSILRRFLRWWRESWNEPRGFAAIGLVLIVLGVTGWLGWRVVQHRVELRNLARANEYLLKEDFRRAWLTLRQAVQVNPDSIEANFAFAEFLDRVGQPEAMPRWQHTVELAPERSMAWLGWLRSALRFDRRDLIERIQAEMPAAVRDHPGYWELGTALALRDNDEGAARAALEAWIRQDPTEPRARVGLAILDLKASDPVVRQSARRTVADAAQGDALRIRAGLALLSITPGDPDVAGEQVAKEILPIVWRRTTPPSLFTVIEYLKQQPNPTSEDAAMLADWMTARGAGREALVWMLSLEKRIWKTWQVAQARARAATWTEDWQSLRSALEDHAWGVVRPSVLDLAFAAEAQHAQFDSDRALQTFGDATDMAKVALIELQVLERLASRWRWLAADNLCLEVITQYFPAETVAWDTLEARALASGEFSRYRDILQRRVVNRPGDQSLAGRLLYLKVLAGTYDRAERLRALDALNDPAAAAGAVAAGAILKWREGSTAEALEALSTYPQAFLTEHPETVLVMATLYALADNQKMANEWRSRVGDSPLLPEEAGLMEVFKDQPAAPRVARPRG